MKELEFLNRLTCLLGDAVPQAENYLVLTKNGEIVSELRTRKKCDDEDECIHKLQARLEMYPRSYPGVVSTESGQSYYAFPILDGQDSFRYILVCVGQERNLDQVYPAYVLISNLYRLR